MFLPPLAPTFEAALRDVAAREPRFRLAAAERLAQLEPGREAEAVTALRTLSADPLGPIRQAAVTALGLLGATEVSELLHASFDDEHAEVRQAAVTAAAAVDDDRSWLIPLLDDPRPEMRYQAVRALATHEPERAAVLLPRLRDEDAGVASAAARALGDLAPHVPPTTRDELATAMARDDVAFAAAVSLAMLGDTRGEPVLVRALADRSLMLEAVEALAHVATPAALDALAAHGGRLFAPLVVRAAVGAALARRGDPRGPPVLARVLGAWRADGRDYAVHAVGELHLEALLPSLLRLARRLRGADPVTLIHSLRAFDRDDAREAIRLLTLRLGAAPPTPETTSV